MAAKKRRRKAATKIGKETRWGSSRRKDEKGRDATPTSSVLGLGDETAETDGGAIGSQTVTGSEEQDDEAEEDGEEEADTGAERDK